MRSYFNGIAFGLVAASLAVVLAFSAGLRPAGAETFTDLRDNVLRNTVQVNENCSGTLVHSALDEKTGLVTSIVLTAKHCIAESRREQMIDFPVYQKNRIVKKDRYIAAVLSQSPKVDLALLVLKDTGTLFEGTAAFAGDDLDVAMGDRVYTAGYPAGLALTITEGLFVSAETIDWPSDGVEYFRSTSNVIGGNSGGAMYHQTAGGAFEIIGVATANLPDAPHMGFYTSAYQIYEYLTAWLPAPVAQPEPDKNAAAAESAPAVGAGG